MVPTFSEGVQYAAGVGLRYYSPIGPIRMDVGFPLNPRSTDDSFQIYFSVGQAF
jgi:translocation and assembly module TamA